MSDHTEELSSIEDKRPHDSGGSVNIAGIDYQHHVTATFCLTMLPDWASLKRTVPLCDVATIGKVLCDAHDDFVLVGKDSAGNAVAEFVQVKRGHGPQWTLAMLYKREQETSGEKTKKGSKGRKGTSILERCLDRDEPGIREQPRFRIVTSAQVDADLHVLTLPRASGSGRHAAPHAARLTSIAQKAREKLHDPKSRCGRDVDWWFRATVWQVLPEAEYLEARNIGALEEWAELHATHPKPTYGATRRAYDEFLKLIHDCAKVVWEVDTRKKKQIDCKEVQQFFEAAWKHIASPVLDAPAPRGTELPVVVPLQRGASLHMEVPVQAGGVVTPIRVEGIPPAGDSSGNPGLVVTVDVRVASGRGFLERVRAFVVNSLSVLWGGQSPQETAEEEERSADLLVDQGRYTEALEAAQSAVRAYQALAKESPEAYRLKLAWAMDRLSRVYDRLGRADMALATAEAALDGLRSIVPASPRAELDLRDAKGTLLGNLGARLLAVGRRDEALGLTRQAIDVYESLLQQSASPRVGESLAGYLNNLALLLEPVDPEALRAAERAMNIVVPLAVEMPAVDWTLAICARNLAQLLVAVSRRAEAIPHARTSVEVRRRLAAKWPLVHRAELAGSLHFLGSWLIKGDATGAVRGDVRRPSRLWRNRSRFGRVSPMRGRARARGPRSVTARTRVRAQRDRPRGCGTEHGALCARSTRAR